jgi:hypothetical protein
MGRMTINHFPLYATAKTLRPLRRRLFRTFCPLCEAILFMKPCFLTRFFFFGCQVLFVITAVIIP